MQVKPWQIKGNTKPTLAEEINDIHNRVGFIKGKVADETARNALTGIQVGDMVFVESLNAYQKWDGTQWITIGGAGGLDRITALEESNCNLMLNLMKTNFKLDSYALISRNQMKNMIVDTFNDTTGIDTAQLAGIFNPSKKCIDTSGGYVDTLVPKLISNTSASPIVVSASSIFNSSYDAWLAFDRVISGISNRWVSSYSLPAWLKVDFGTPTPVNVYSVRCIDSTDSAQAPKTWTFEGSNDNTNWTVIQSVGINTNDPYPAQTGWTAAERRIFHLPSTVQYRYYRINIRSSNGASVTSITEFEIGQHYTGPINVVSTKDVLNIVPSTFILVVDAIVPSGGSAAYYVSRDGGTTWKQVIPEQVTSLDDLPVGNELVVKASISNNNEYAALNAWAYAWS